MTSQVDLDDLASAQKWDTAQLEPKGFRAIARAIVRRLLLRLRKAS